MINKKDLCIYCGKEATTRDHVPPKSFFIKPAPSNLITVPSCFKCNNRLSKDEEYCRNILTSAWQDDGSTKVAKEIWHGPVSRSLKRNPKLFEDIFEGIVTDDIHTKIFFKEDRVYPVIEKIVKGLFYNIQGRPLSKDYIIIILLNPDQNSLSKEIIEFVESSESHELAGGVIRYKNIFLTKKPDYSVWKINFYNNVNGTFYCITRKGTD